MESLDTSPQWKESPLPLGRGMFPLGMRLEEKKHVKTLNTAAFLSDSCQDHFFNNKISQSDLKDLVAL